MKITRTRVLEVFDHRNAWWIAAVLFAGALAWYWDQTTPKETSDPHRPEKIDAADTFIPAGFVLVPIEVANYESLDSILGKFGVVDLYVPAADPARPPRKVASRIKILRAPLNPSHFAVLAREEDSVRLVQQASPFTVVVQNPARSGTSFVNTAESRRGDPRPARPRSRIFVEVFNAE